MQILDIDIFTGMLYSLVKGLFRNVAKMYDLLMELARNGGRFEDYAFTFDNLMTTMYVLAGVFMLFRATIALIQMLINPDMVSDSKIGASKIVYRVVISLSLLIILTPGGLIFGEKGLCHRLEHALINEKGEGLIDRVLDQSETSLKNGVGIKDSKDKKKKTDNTKFEGENRDYLIGIDEGAVKFAQNTAKSFQECQKDKTKECADAQKYMFVTKDGDKQVKKKMTDGDPPTLDFDGVMSILVGLGLILYLGLLCVDVIVRRFKLMLLEVLAPIPIISYVDPKDQVFGKWGKMYISVYLDLFIKLIAIAVAIILLEIVGDGLFLEGNEDNTGRMLLIKFFYIVAILVFAKAIPSMISKIFGLETSNSFKDIMKLTKAAGGGALALGTYAGAKALTTAANVGNILKQTDPKWTGKKKALAITGAIGGGVLSAVGGGVGAIAAGSKGNYTGTASRALRRGRVERDARDEGATYLETKKAQLYNALGFDTPYKKAEAMKKANETLMSTMDEATEQAKNIALKEGKHASSKGAFRNYSLAKDALARAQATGVGVEQATADFKKAEKQAVIQVMKDIKDKKLGKNNGYVDIKDDDAVDFKKAESALENAENAAQALGIDLFVKKDNKGKIIQSGVWNKEYKDKAEIAKIDAEKQMRQHKGEQDLVEFNKNNK